MDKPSSSESSPASKDDRVLCSCSRRKDDVEGADDVVDVVEPLSELVSLDKVLLLFITISSKVGRKAGVPVPPTKVEGGTRACVGLLSWL